MRKNWTCDVCGKVLLGFKTVLLNHKETVKTKIEQIDQDFDLVMIAEDFDSSTVLLYPF